MRLSRARAADQRRVQKQKSAVLRSCLHAKLSNLCFGRKARKVHSDPRLPLCEFGHLRLPVAHALGLQLNLGRKAALNRPGSACALDAQHTQLQTCVVTAAARTALSCSRRMLWSLWLFSAARMAWTLLLAVSSN